MGFPWGQNKVIIKSHIVGSGDFGCKGGIHHPKDQQSGKVAGSPSKPQRETNQLERAVLSQRRCFSFQSLPQPEGSLSPFFLSSRLCGRILPKFSPLPPGSMAIPSPGPRRWRLPREKGAANVRGTPGVHRSGALGGPGTRVRPSQGSRGPSRRPPSGDSDLEGPALSPPRQQARPTSRSARRKPRPGDKGI